MHFGLLTLLFCAACSGGSEQPDNKPSTALPISQDGAINVYGELIDVREVAAGDTDTYVYPINEIYYFDESLPTELGKLKCAVSVKEKMVSPDDDPTSPF